MKCAALNIAQTLEVTLRSSHPYKRRILHDWSYERLVYGRPAGGGEYTHVFACTCTYGHWQVRKRHNFPHFEAP